MYVEKRKMFIIALLFISGISSAKVFKVSSVRKFDERLSKSRMSIVMFYSYDKQIKDDKTLKRELENQKEMFESVSKYPQYQPKAANLKFIRFKVEEDEFNSITQEYNVSEFPTYIAFIGAQPTRTVVQGQDMLAKIEGFTYRPELEQFIEKQFGKEINEVLKEKREARQRELERAKINAYKYPAYYGGYYPYGYFYPYWFYNPYPWGVGYGGAFYW